MKNFKEKIVLLLTSLNLATFFSLRYIYSGLMNVVGGQMWIVYVLFGLHIFVLIISIINRFYFQKLFLWITSLVINILFLGLYLYMLFETIDYILYFVRNISLVLFVFITIYAFLYVIHYLIKRPEYHIKKPDNYKRKVAAHTVLFILTFGLSLIKVFDLGVMYFITKPVVYAVNNEYQIVFETSRKATAEVKIGNKTYYDTSSGAIISSSKMHKVIVPMDLLNSEKEYHVSSTNVLYRGPYNGIMARTITHTSSFRPLDASDGIKFHVGSDFHDKKKSRVASMTYKQEELDFVVLAGDISSFLETRRNISFINQSAYEISKGEIAVIYNRGNHETKGLYRDELAKAVSSYHDNFYFTVSLGNVFIIVLDLAEDHNDDWWEFYGTANYQKYRNEQIAWLQEIQSDINNIYNLSSYDYRIVISHQPVTVVNEIANENFLENERNIIVKLLNALQIDASFSGHFHQLYYLHDLPESELTVQEGFNEKHFVKGLGANFPEFVTSKHALSQFEENSKTKEVYTSLRVELTTLNKTAYFVNSKHEIVEIKEPINGLTHTLINF